MARSGTESVERVNAWHRASHVIHPPIVARHRTRCFTVTVYMMTLFNTSLAFEDYC